ncbi:MAG: IclR family transcriptional regulator [Bacilli bacterium]
MRTSNSSLKNALRILKTFSVDHTELTLDEFAANNGISKSTACRLLQTLESEGFIVQNTRSNTYHLGLSVLYLANIMLEGFYPLKEMTRYLKKCTEETGESSHIAVLQRKEVIYLKKEDNQYRIHLQSHIGKRNPAHCTASGLALLAYVDEQTIREWYADGFERPTKYSISSIEQLLKRLEDGRAKGYFISEREMVEDVLAVGAPIFNKDGEVLASISIAGLHARMKPQLSKITQLVKETSKEISCMIQHSKEPLIHETYIG